MAKKKGNNYIINESENVAKIELQRMRKESLWVIVDAEDLRRILDFPYTWFSSYRPDINDYYACASRYNGKNENGKFTSKPVLLHQFIMCANSDQRVDHINGNGLDDRKENLRVTNDFYNTKNRKGKNKNNSSGYRNISWDGYKWVVQLQVNGKNTALARFPHEQLEEAAKFAKLMREKYYGEFAGNA